MTTKDQALKLALAGLVKASRYGFGEFEEEKSAISSAIQHLEMAEQPAQQQEPFCYHDGHDIVGKEFADHSDVFPLYTAPQPSKPLTDEQEYEAIGTAGNDLLELAKRWADNEVHVYQFDNEARKIIKAVLHRAHAKGDA